MLPLRGPSTQGVPLRSAGKTERFPYTAHDGQTWERARQNTGERERRENPLSEPRGNEPNWPPSVPPRPQPGTYARELRIPRCEAILTGNPTPKMNPSPGRFQQD